MMLLTVLLYLFHGTNTTYSTYKSEVIFICETDICTNVTTKRRCLKILVDIESIKRENKTNGVIFIVLMEATVHMGRYSTP